MIDLHKKTKQNKTKQKTEKQTKKNQTLLIKQQESLSPCDRNFEESYDRSKISDFILVYQKYPFGELFSKITFKTSIAFSFFQKIEKFKLPLDALSGPPGNKQKSCIFTTLVHNNGNHSCFSISVPNKSSFYLSYVL